MDNENLDCNDLYNELIKCKKKLESDKMSNGLKRTKLNKTQLMEIIYYLEDLENSQGVVIMLSDFIELIQDCNTIDEAKKWIKINI